MAHRNDGLVVPDASIESQKQARQQILLPTLSQKLAPYLAQLKEFCSWQNNSFQEAFAHPYFRNKYDGMADVIRSIEEAISNEKSLSDNEKFIIKIDLDGCIDLCLYVSNYQCDVDTAFQQYSKFTVHYNNLLTLLNTQLSANVIEQLDVERDQKLAAKEVTLTKAPSLADLAAKSDRSYASEKATAQPVIEGDQKIKRAEIENKETAAQANEPTAEPINKLLSDAEAERKKRQKNRPINNEPPQSEAEAPLQIDEKAAVRPEGMEFISIKGAINFEISRLETVNSIPVLSHLINFIASVFVASPKCKIDALTHLITMIGKNKGDTLNNVINKWEGLSLKQGEQTTNATVISAHRNIFSSLFFCCSGKKTKTEEMVDKLKKNYGETRLT